MHTKPEVSDWQAAADSGCDMLLLENNLKKTPPQRIDAHRVALRMVEALAADGFAIIPEVIDRRTVEDLKLAIEEAIPKSNALSRRSSVYGARNLLRDVPAIQALAGSLALRTIVTPGLASRAFPVRCLLFDKTAVANWPVVWHQDLTIAVRERRDVAGFGSWTIKAGVPHTQPPVRILRKMLTVRLHLDDCTEDNGPLLVVPGSHKRGILTADQIQKRTAKKSPTKCLVSAGGALVMKPLLIHSSARAIRPSHRRVIHLEYAATSLPGGLEWDHFTPAT